MNDPHTRDILTRCLDILQHVRQRPEMYVRQVTPEGVEAWLAGYSAGLLTAGVRSSAYGLSDACERRGIAFTSTVDLIAALAGQGHSPHDVAMMLIDIEEEMWRSSLADVSGDVGGHEPRPNGG
jgi:hypothetical protein